VCVINYIHISYSGVVDSNISELAVRNVIKLNSIINNCIHCNSHSDIHYIHSLGYGLHTLTAVPKLAVWRSGSVIHHVNKVALR